MDAVNFDQLKHQAEDAIRSGDRDRARAILSKLQGKNIPRARTSELATLARRAGLSRLALKIMLPIIRPKVALEKEATDEEKAAYAIILLGVGASTEALEILANGNPQNAEVNLALAFTHINRWDYPAAIRYLRNYLSDEGQIPYQRMVAKVNLAASYVALGDIHEGKPLLEQIRRATLDNHWSLLHKNALELSAQLAIQEKDWDQALDFLSKASSEKQQDLSNVFVRKWKAVLGIMRDGPTEAAQQEITDVRNLAVTNNHWETVRDCDYHLALVTKNHQLLERLYFGTPYDSFRERILKHSKDWFKPPTRYTWHMTGAIAERVFDLRQGEEIGTKVAVKAGKSLHIALQTLVSDFYKPFVIGSLHASLFPGEHFNPESSPRRVAFLIHRLREFIAQENLPLTIQVAQEGYRLVANEPYAFLISCKSNAEDQDSPAQYAVILSKIQTQFETANFSVTELASHLDISVRSARYFLKWAVESEKLKRLGTGRSTQYKLAEKKL